MIWTIKKCPKLSLQGPLNRYDLMPRKSRRKNKDRRKNNKCMDMDLLIGKDLDKREGI